MLYHKNIANVLPPPMEENESFIYRSYQDHNCLNVSLFSDSLYNYSFIPTPETPIKYVKVNLQIIQDEFGLNNFDENNPSHLTYLNSLFSETWSGSVNGIFESLSVPVYEGEEGDYYIEDSRIRFSVEGIYFHQDDGGLNQINGTSHWNFGQYVESNFGINTDTEINIYLVPSGYHADLGNTSLGGYGPPGSSNTDPAYIGKVVMYNVYYNFIETGGQHWILNPLIGHELGHVFGLHHTFHYSQYLLFYPQLFWPESNSWCSPMNDTHCSNNMMGYNNSKKWLAPLQVGHIHRVLASNPVRTRYLKFCNYDESQDIVIDGRTDWSIATVVGGNIIIESGNTLELSCLLSMPKDGKIIIQPGAKLIVDGGIITNSCGDYWQGIYVEGDRFLPQTFENQGALILQNGAIIENAKDAVMLKGVDDDWAYTGGIIQATDATFRNNWRNVEFMSYQNTNTQGQPIDNISYFTNCTFITDDETLHDTHTANVTMWDVTGVWFTNCTFTDERDNIDYYGYRTSRDGIYTKEATFRVWGSEFNHMKFGIHSIATIPNRYFSVYLSDFSSFKGIYFNAKDNVIIMDNTFHVAPGYTYPGSKCGDTYGIYINNSSNFKIENNQLFSTSNGATMCGSLGIIARNTGSYTNEIYRNDLEGFTVGIEAIGENKGQQNYKGLELKCNRNLENAFDFFVTKDGLYINTGIRELQGYSATPTTSTLAGNLFGNNSSILVANFINTEANISYYHHNPASESRVVPAIYSDPPKINLYPTGHNFNYALSCPQEFVPKNLAQLELERTESIALYSETELIMQSHMDDGNTELMTQQVEMAGDGDAYSTYQYLMQTSPFLSEEVLTALGAKEEGFNKAMIRDVLVENPQSAKSEDVSLALDNRQDPLPAYMRWQINNGLNHFSEMEVMRHFMAYQKTRHDRALNQILGGIIRNEEGFENAPPVEEILAGVDDIRYQYMLAEWHFGKGDFSQGMQLLGQIEQDYDLSEEAVWNAHEDKLGFYNWLSQWDQEEHPGYTQLPEDALQELHNYLDATPRIAGKALSLLVLNEAIEYEEPILYPDVVLKSEPAHQQTMPLIPEMDEEFTFRLYPNPSREYITLDWCFDSPQMKGVIEIRNASGVLLDAIQVRNQCDQQIYPLIQLRSGTYTATLVSGNHIRKSLSFVVIK
jgi:hypothetical protein